MSYFLVTVIAIVIVLLITMLDYDTINCIRIGALFLIVIALAERSQSSTQRSVFGGAADAKQDFIKMKLLDPKHNLREVSKQLVLLEDHLVQKNKRCSDCISKHYLMTEALLEEAIALDIDGKMHDEIRKVLQDIKPPMMNLISKIKNGVVTDELYTETSQQLRSVRKVLCSKYILDN